VKWEVRDVESSSAVLLPAKGEEEETEREARNISRVPLCVIGLVASHQLFGAPRNVSALLFSSIYLRFCCWLIQLHAVNVTKKHFNSPLFCVKRRQTNVGAVVCARNVTTGARTLSAVQVPKRRKLDTDLGDRRLR
jgi:hypothetical protein